MTKNIFLVMVLTLVLGFYGASTGLAGEHGGAKLDSAEHGGEEVATATAAATLSDADVLNEAASALEAINPRLAKQVKDIAGKL